MENIGCDGEHLCSPSHIGEEEGKNWSGSFERQNLAVKYRASGDTHGANSMRLTDHGEPVPGMTPSQNTQAASVQQHPPLFSYREEVC